jgi:hypothetical protein
MRLPQRDVNYKHTPAARTLSENIHGPCALHVRPGENRGAELDPAGQYCQNLPKLIINSYLRESKKLVCVCDRIEDLTA